MKFSCPECGEVLDWPEEKDAELSHRKCHLIFKRTGGSQQALAIDSGCGEVIAIVRPKF